MNVSPDFSLPLRLIAPYFVVAALFYILSMSMLVFLQPDITLRDVRVIGWVHAYMIGFVMMVIIGAMGQLSVVVGGVLYESQDASVRWRYHSGGFGSFCYKFVCHPSPQP